MSLRSWVWPLSVAAGVLAAPHPARAEWREARLESDDLRIRLESDGRGTLEHRTRLRIGSAKLRTFDLGPAPDDEVELGPAALVAEDGAPAPSVHVAVAMRGAARIVRLFLDSNTGARRGTYLLTYAHAVDLSRDIRADGALSRVTYRAAPLDAGRDAVKVVFDLPAAGTEPRASVDAVSGEGATILSAVRRLGGRDELELVRPHVAQGERAEWAARVDPKAFAALATGGASVPSAPRVSAPAASPLPGRLRAASLILLAGALFALAARRRRDRDAGDELRRPQPLVGVPRAAGVLGYGVGGMVGVAQLLFGTRSLGVALIALAMVLAIDVTPRVSARPRAKGTWRAVRPSELLAERRVSARGGVSPALWGCAAALVAAGAAMAYVVRFSVAGALWLLPAALVCLVAPLLATGWAATSSADRATRWLLPLARRLRAASGCEATFLARGALGARGHDDHRLRIVPRGAMSGLVAIDVGVAWTPLAVGTDERPEVLVRVVSGSAAAGRLVTFSGRAPMLPGAREDERVVRLVPPAATATALRALVVELVGALSERREDRSEHGYRGPERREHTISAEETPLAPPAFV